MGGHASLADVRALERAIADFDDYFHEAVGASGPLSGRRSGAGTGFGVLISNVRFALATYRVSRTTRT